jgi:uncharacterized protein (DUF305 family)
MLPARSLVLLACISAAFALGACGGDDPSDGSGDATPAQHTDGAFIAEMIPHHEGAIEMAEPARERAEHSEIAAMAEQIIATQSDEVRELEAAHERLFDGPVGSVDHGTLGLSAAEAGMSHDSSELDGAEPFDQAFIDMMIPHHQGAIRMARVELERGEDEELKALAEEIIEAQSAEIEQMNAWRERWYGERSPAEGVPGDGEAPAHEEMGH